MPQRLEIYHGGDGAKAKSNGKWGKESKEETNQKGGGAGVQGNTPGGTVQVIQSPQQPKKKGKGKGGQGQSNKKPKEEGK